MKCVKGFDVLICKSAAGYYLGTKDFDGMPNCRLTGYSETESGVNLLPLTRQYGCIENEHCHGGFGCFPGVDE